MNVQTTEAFAEFASNYGPTADVLLRAAENGHPVFAVVHSVARSGMSRVMRFYVLDNGSMVNIDIAVIELGFGQRTPKGHGVRVSGCGMDMGFHVTNSLGCKLFGHDLLKAPRYL